MNRQVRAVAGIVVIAILFFVVLGYWNQYRRAAELVSTTSSKAASYESTSKGATGTATTAKSGTSSSSKSSATATSAKPKKGDKIVTVQIAGLNFRESPDKNANVIRGLDENEVLVWISTDGSWYKVRDASGVEGYITSSDQYAKLGKQK